MNIIELEKVSKKYTLIKKKPSLFLFHEKEEQEFYALKNVSLKINKGECLGIVGENGSGKTTLLKIIGDIIKPTSGAVRTNGNVLNLLGIGTGFQEELTGRENIYLYGSLLGFSKKEIDNNLENIIGFSGIQEFIDVKLKNYSSGMKVRLAFSVAMAHNPDILLIDEILAVGDELFQKQSLGKIKKMKEMGKTIIFVSHNLHLINDFCDRVIYLQHGEIVEVGNPKKVLHSYLNNISEYRNSGKIEENLLKVSNNPEKDIIREDAYEQIVNTVQLIDKDLSLLEKQIDLNNKEKHRLSITKLINKLVTLKEKQIIFADNEEKIKVLDDIKYLLNKKLSYTTNIREKQIIYNKIGIVLLKNIQSNSNPYTRSSRIQDLMDIYPSIDKSNTLFLKEVKLFLSNINPKKLFDDFSNLRTDYENFCLYSQLNQQNRALNTKKFCNLLKQNIKKNSKTIFEFIFIELRDRLLNPGYKLDLKLDILLTFLKIINSKPKLIKLEVQVLTKNINSAQFQIGNRITGLKEEEITHKVNNSKKINYYINMRNKLRLYYKKFI